jgi:hypothetical protein
MSRHDEIKKLWKEKLNEPQVHSCFCYIYRCPHRDYSLCPKDCEKPSVNKVCPQGDCQMQLQHPEECEKQVCELQERAGEKPTYVNGEPIINRTRKRSSI